MSRRHPRSNPVWPPKLLEPQVVSWMATHRPQLHHQYTTSPESWAFICAHLGMASRMREASEAMKRFGASMTRTRETLGLLILPSA